MISTSHIETLKSFFVFFLFLFLLWGSWQMFFDYLHPYPYCSIEIKKHFSRGDAQSIKEALSTLRENDLAAYKTVCRYVERIEERRCYNADARIDYGAFSMDHEGCYIRGTNTIYLKPVKYSKQNVELRIEAIKALGEKSKNFWTKGPQEESAEEEIRTSEERIAPVKEHDIDEDTAERVQEFIDEGIDEDEAVELAEEGI